ncbi:MAG TPA: chromate resistance protein ChrB domain-containing protein [Stellaceae bacterium]|nr:chromate resistance protein ChrB domain-containing protein [Stellaceae bacterium]
MKRKPPHPNSKKAEASEMTPWLLLVHQLPPKPAYLRVKIWRRLQSLGAISVKNSVYALPANEQALEDFQWLLREIEQGGGEGMVCEAKLVDGLSDQEVRALFDAARDADYDEIAKALRALAGTTRRKGKVTAAEGAELKVQLARLRRRFAEINAIDFHGATGRMTVEGLLSEIEARLAGTTAEESLGRDGAPKATELLGKTWVTRRGVHVDRIACAWLVRRFIDPEARFKFVATKDYAAEPGELRFDMFKAEFTHEGDRCSFEVLLERAGLADPALRAIAEVVHDIDLKDGKFARDETAGIAHVIAGICTTQKDDVARLERGGAILDDIYEYFRKKRGR